MFLHQTGLRKFCDEDHIISLKNVLSSVRCIIYSDDALYPVLHYLKRRVQNRLRGHYFVYFIRRRRKLIRECENLKRCGFFKKYASINALACKGLINLYCRGEKQQQCKRNAFRRKTGKPPSDDMMPNGLMKKM